MCILAVLQVHAALDPASMRCVAIKLYSEADRAVRDHFIEASMLDRIRQLGHRHVIRLFDELRGPNNTVTGLVLYPLCAETLQQRLQVRRGRGHWVCRYRVLYS
jgi:hypothetical protein